MQPVKGVIVFNAKEKGYLEQAMDLLKTIDCQVVSSMGGRMTVTTSRGNLQKIKQSWQSTGQTNTLSTALKRQVAQIIIGGSAN